MKSCVNETIVTCSMERRLHYRPRRTGALACASFRTPLSRPSLSNVKIKRPYGKKEREVESVAKNNTAEVLWIEGREVSVPPPNKPYFSKQTKLSKLELVRYYLSIAPGALAGIRDRPLVLK